MKIPSLVVYFRGLEAGAAHKFGCNQAQAPGLLLGTVHVRRTRCVGPGCNRLHLNAPHGLRMPSLLVPFHQIAEKINLSTYDCPVIMQLCLPQQRSFFLLR
jgi:hypothetical protein